MPQSRKIEKTPIVFLVIAYVLTSIGLIAVNLPAVLAFDLPDTDDYMRLQQVRDWLDGQAWHDVDQHRFVTEAGGDMHFSRLPDVFMAGLILVFQPFFGERGAELAMLTFYPVLLLLPFFLATAKLATLVGGRRAGFATIAITPFTHAALWQFSSGRIDHHSLQIVLLMCALYCAVRAIDKPRIAIGAALSCILMMAVGMETLPFVIAVALGVGLIWLLKEQPRALTYFGAGLVMFAFPLLWLENAGGDASVVLCDVYSPPYAMGAFASGFGAIALGLAAPRLSSIILRIVAALFAGVGAVAVTAAVYPECLSAGPYSMVDEEGLEAWFLFGNAVRSVTEVLSQDGFFEKAFVYLIPLISMCVGLYLIVKRKGRAQQQMVIICLALGGGALLALWQLRMSPFANALAILPMAAMLGQIREELKDYKPRSLIRAGLLGLFVSPLPYVGAAFADGVIKKMNAPTSEEMAKSGDMQLICMEPDNIGALRSLPPGLVMNQINLGPRILAMTDHSISSGFYHRNMKAVIRSVRFFDGSAEKAACDLAERPVDYVVYCPIGRRMGEYDLDEESLSEIFDRGETPAWLEEIDLDDSGPLRVFRTVLNKTDKSQCPRQAPGKSQ